MKRSVKIGLVSAVCAVVGVSAAGISVATTTTTPITLCVNKATNTLRAPASGGTCSKLETAIQVASSADVQSLATRLDGDEAKQATDEGSIQALQTTLSTLQTNLSSDGSNITTLQSQLNSLQQTLGTVQTSQGADEAAITNLNKNLSDLNLALGAAQTKQASDEAAITSLQHDLGQLQTVVSSVRSNQATDETSITTLQTHFDAEVAVVNALSSQLTADEHTISSQAAAITTLTSRLTSDETTITAMHTALTGHLSANGAQNVGSGIWTVSVTGYELKPNALITAHWTANGSAGQSNLTTAGLDGTFSGNPAFPCTDTNVYFTSTDAFGTVTSETWPSGPGC